MKFNPGTIIGAVGLLIAVAVASSNVAGWFTGWRTSANFRFDALESRMDNLESEIREIRELIEERLPAAAPPAP